VPQDVQDEIKKDAFSINKFIYKENADKPVEVIVETQV
jgi:hypothetical protein